MESRYSHLIVGVIPALDGLSGGDLWMKSRNSLTSVGAASRWWKFEAELLRIVNIREQGGGGAFHVSHMM